MHMILKKVKLQNFRGFKNFEVDFDADFNVIIEKNDIGKSTILEALEIFFNSEKIKLEIEDLCVYAKEPIISIICCFDVGDGTILIDTTNYTNCRDEFLLNKEGLLEIKKSWDCSSGSITKNSLKTYIVAYYPTRYAKPLVLEKISSLQKMYDKYKDDPTYIPEKCSISAELRRAIYSKELVPPIECSTTDIDTSKDDAKNIGDSLSRQFPQYFLFESDRKNTDKDSEIQDPLKAVTKTVLAEMDVEIEKLQQKVKEHVEEIGHRTIQKLAELDGAVAKDIKPVVSLKPIYSSFNFDLVSDNGIPLNKRGSGVRRLVLLSYFRAEAEKAIVQESNRQLIYAIEEPETSQHPDYQRMIFETLNELSLSPSHQIIVTSHTPEIAKLVGLKQLIFLMRSENGDVIAENDEHKKAKYITADLGILPYAATKTIICVEGPNDVNFLFNLNQNIPELKSIIDLQEEHIPLIPIQGGRLVDWINQDYFKLSNLKEIYITDNDVEKYLDLIQEIDAAQDGRRFGWSTQRREMENYFPRKLVEKEFGIILDKYKEDWYQLDVPKLLAGVCMQNIDNIDKREQIIKSRLNGSLSKKVSKEDLERIGVWEEIETWFKKIKSIDDGTYAKKSIEN